MTSISLRSLGFSSFFHQIYVFMLNMQNNIYRFIGMRILRFLYGDSKQVGRKNELGPDLDGH